MKDSGASRKLGTSQLSLEQQTRLSWASFLTKYQEVPEEFQYFFERLKSSGQPFPFTVITPSYEGFLHRFQERLVCIIDQELFILSKAKGVQEKLFFCFKDINVLEFKKVLLDSSLIISGIDGDGKPNRVDLHFNTVTEGLFWEIMKRIRQSFFTNTVYDEKPIFHELREESFKFASYSRNCLIPGERVADLLWQPELKANHVNIKLPQVLFDFFSRIVFPNHVMLLTDQELIIISEDENENRREKYGAIWQFVPLEKIRQMTINFQEDGLLVLGICLEDESIIRTLFQDSEKEKLEQILNEISSLQHVRFQVNHSF